MHSVESHSDKAFSASKWSAPWTGPRQGDGEPEAPDYNDYVNMFVSEIILGGSNECR